MIYVTGDCHGDFRRFSSKNFPAQRTMRKERDYVILLGDAPLLWDDSPEERFWLDFLQSKNFTVLNIGGNHENFDLLQTCPEVPFQGGLARRIRPSVWQLSRGWVYHLCGRKVFCMGGAQSHDTDLILPRNAASALRRRLRRRGTSFRVEGETWWPSEMPSREEYRTALKNLGDTKQSVDLVLTHCAPSFIQRRAAPTYPINELTDFFDEIVRNGLCYRQWFCGHYHKEWYCETEEFRILYESIVPISESEVFDHENDPHE